MSVEGVGGVGGPLSIPASLSPAATRQLALRMVADLLSSVAALGSGPSGAAQRGQLRAQARELSNLLVAQNAQGRLDTPTMKLALARLTAVDQTLSAPVQVARPTVAPVSDSVELSMPLSMPLPMPLPKPPQSGPPGTPALPVPGHSVQAGSAVPALPGQVVKLGTDPLLELAALPLQAQSAWSADEIETWVRHVLPFASEHVDQAVALAARAGARQDHQLTATVLALVTWSAAVPLPAGLVPIEGRLAELQDRLRTQLPDAVVSALAAAAVQPPLFLRPLGASLSQTATASLYLVGVLVLVAAIWLGLR